MKSFTAGLRHPKIRQVINLLKNRTQNRENLFIIEGMWPHKKLIHTDLKPITFFYCPEIIFSREARGLYHYFLERSTCTLKVSEKVFKKITSRKRPDGLLSVCKFPGFTYSHIGLKSKNLVLVLDGLEKPGNIGTLIRSLNGIGGNAVFICNRRVRLTHSKIVKSSCGINFSMPVIETTVSGLSTWLIKHHFTVYLATCNSAETLSAITYPGRMAIVLGNERYGISKEWYKIDHKSITIPMRGIIDSYNVAVAGSIIMYEAGKFLFG